MFLHRIRFCNVLITIFYFFELWTSETESTYQKPYWVMLLEICVLLCKLQNERSSNPDRGDRENMGGEGRNSITVKSKLAHGWMKAATSHSSFMLSPTLIPPATLFGHSTPCFLLFPCDDYLDLSPCFYWPLFAINQQRNCTNSKIELLLCPAAMTGALHSGDRVFPCVSVHGS